MTPATLAEPLLGSTVDLVPTLTLMKYRALRRVFAQAGGYKDKPHVTAFWTILYLAVPAALSALDAGGFRPCGVRLSWDADNLMLGAIFTAAALLTVTRSVDVIRWCLFWTYLAVMVLLATDNFTLDGRASSATLRHRLLVALVALEVATLGVYHAVYHVLPKLTLWLIETLDHRWWLELHSLGPCADDDDSGGGGGSGAPRHAFEYRLRLPWVEYGATHVASYRGALHPRSGRPHGEGEWVDDAFHGECLHGVWDDGAPRGPFRSREFGSGYAFVSLRVVVAANHDDPFARSRPRVQRIADAGALRLGVASVECSVSGQFFRRFPHAQLLDGPAVASRRNSRLLSGATAAERNATGVGRCLKLLAGGSADDAAVAAPAPTEALVYVPGFNTDLKFALKRFGQLLALANFPPSFAPVVFSWPGGWNISYRAAQRATASAWMASDFLALCEALAAQGVTTLHVLAHSMGAAVALHAIPMLLDSTLLASGRFRVASVVLLSPDFPLRPFLRSSYTRLRALGGTITVYGDRNDRPLVYSEWYNRERALGRLWGAPWEAEAAEDDEIAESGEAARWLDLDVVDTTGMEAGLPAGDLSVAVNIRLRHSHFTINQLMVDDLRELLVCRRRAAARATRLRRRAGNVYHFLVPPSAPES